MSRLARLLLSLWIAAILVSGCGLSPAPAPESTAPPIPAADDAPTLPVSTPLSVSTRSPLPTLTPTSIPTATPPEIPRPRRVLILSIDGLRPDAIALAPMPILLSLMETGAYSLTAQTTFPSATLPAHASMLTGQCPAKHGVDWNDYMPWLGYANGPSIFTLAKDAGLRTIMVAGKEKLRQITPPETTDIYHFIPDRDLVIAAEIIPELQQGFGLAFIHFPTADWMGHGYGWLSPEQLSVLRRADEALDNILAALEEAGIREDTLLIITSDHGGREYSHGSRHPEDMTIPWVIHGPGALPGKIPIPVNVTDTAATAAWALNLPIPPEWDGSPLIEIFGEQPAERPDPRCP
jgi:hypothetical protein